MRETEHFATAKMRFSHNHCPRNLGSNASRTCPAFGIHGFVGALSLAGPKFRFTVEAIVR